jgi:hypothetical protein
VSAAYLDTSCVIAIAFDEPGGRELAARLERYGALLSASLLEAELLSTLALEGVEEEPALLSAITWVFPERPLGPEVRYALSRGYARGADLWHLATALYLADEPSSLPFFTLDPGQRDIAAALGFPTP